MKTGRNAYYSLVVCALGLFSATGTFGAEEGGSAAEQSVGVIFKWIHFVILAGLVYWVFGKLLQPVFRRNAYNISSAITKATAAKVEAERKLQEAVTKMGNLEREIAEFRVQAQRDAAAEVERLRGATVLDVEKIRTAAKAEIEAAERAARVELKELAAKLAVDGAESLVAKQMTPSVQEAMIGSFVQSLQGRPN
ncbi:MAG TPA: ATP synthase F0 subunit B [Candidatus Acidoferrales bacterium]|jgi:F-type H+-transporting ATPase subunit b|nr:ATP synthase F0 subunit B [Candidatus Acidoferrales bacterium]